MGVSARFLVQRRLPSARSLLATMFAIAAFLALALTQLVAAQYPPQGPYLQVRSLGNICVTMLKETRPSVGVKGERTLECYVEQI
jgi:hypothetical protein